MATFKTFLQESKNDKGIFKAIFILGIPGAGKSYTLRRLAGQVSPRIVNTDKAVEFLSYKLGIAVHARTWGTFRDRSTHLTKAALANYLNGVLPLFIDGTSNDASNLLHRMGILESLGYDVGLIHVKTSLDVAIKRASERADAIGRHVDEDFIRDVFEHTDENIQFLKHRVSFFKEINNDDMHLSDNVLNDAFKKTQGFFASPILNPIGQRLLDKMEDENESYLSPNIISKEALAKKIEGWYR